MDKHLHIVAFDVPYPPVYGGVIDLYFQLKSLHQIGVKITYHCFYYQGNSSPSDRLEMYCDKVFYYHRKRRVGKMILSQLPFIVATRNDRNLLANLETDDSPIIFSGLQSCYFLDHPNLKSRIKLVRTHNIEHEYYRGLAEVEKNRLKKQYFLWEAKKLEKFEKILVNAAGILSIAKMDLDHFKQYAPVHHSPPYFRFKKRKHNFEATPLFGLFQGNLSVGENVETVQFICKHIALHTKHQIIFAGKDPSKEVIALSKTSGNIQLIANPSQEKMNELIENAQVNLLFTKQQTGIKLKLLHALAIGKHIIINSKMDDCGLFENLCKIEDDPEAILEQFEKLMKLPYSNTMFDKRQEQFLNTFDNELNAVQTLAILSALE